ncbi:MAG: DUF3800 domain-containing protein [Terriglobia bacterium]
MAHFLFVDESGYDAGESPYGVLAGIGVEDRDLWSLVKDIRAAERNHFGGVQYSGGERELKAKKLLKRKVFRQASALEPFPPEQRAALARECLEKGDRAGACQITALAQAKIAYVMELMDICARFRRKAFASVVSKTSPAPSRDHLRKDYAYLFERFFYYLEDVGPSAYGIIVFDELEKIQSHLLVEQMDRYFKLTARGRQRSSQILPEPLFVHSDLTTGVQLADLVAYTISWGVRFGGMDAPVRAELNDLAQRVTQLRHRSIREVNQTPNFVVWSLAYIRDLRSREERDTDAVEVLFREDEGSG